MYDVVTVGSALLDVLASSTGFKIVKSKEFPGGVALCEAFEGKMEAGDIEIASGGGGSNNAVSFARKGLRTAIVSEIGADLAGRMVSSELTREGVGTRHLVIEEGEETGVSVVLVSSDGGRTIITYRGASRMLTHKDFPWKALKTKWIHVSSLGGKIGLLEEICRWAKKNGVRIAVNPGNGELKYRERLWKCVGDVDVLLLNREEATKLTGIDWTDAKVFKSESCLVGPRISVITAGEKGGRVCVEGKCHFYTGSKVKKVCSVGAGDAFGSGFVAALIYEKSVDEAIEWGRKNAEAVLGCLSAKKALLRLSQLKTP